MEWASPVHKRDTTYDIPGTWLFLHYYEALNILFRIENSLRTFVYVVLKNVHGSKWTELSIGSDDGDTTIAAVASRRRSQAGTFGYLGYPASSPLLFLSTGELTRLITSDAYWRYFAQYFPAAKGIVATKFEEINSVRNALAHFRPLKGDDVETVTQSSKHVLTRMEACLYALLNCDDTVPTNSPHAWYAALRVLGSPYCALSFSQSADEEWVAVTLTFTSPHLKDHTSDSFRRIDALTVEGPAILREHADLANYVTCTTERIPYSTVRREGAPAIRKRIVFGFSQKTLTQAGDSIRNGMEQLLSQISEETELIQQDNLARGRIVRSAHVTAHFKENQDRAVVDARRLVSSYSESDPAEWWGGVSSYSQHFVSSTERYPWMATDVSAEPLPF
jgi:hypothetical protein